MAVPRCFGPRLPRDELKCVLPLVGANILSVHNNDLLILLISCDFGPSSHRKIVKLLYFLQNLRDLQKRHTNRFAKFTK